MASFKSRSAAAATILLALLLNEQGSVFCQDDKRQGLVPFPRIGKRQGLIPFPRIGRSVGQPSAVFASAGPGDEPPPFGVLDADENWDQGVDFAYMLVPDYMKRGSGSAGGHSAFTPRIGRRKRSLGSDGSLSSFSGSLSGLSRPPLRRLLPEDLQALFRRTMRQLIPSPRVGRADAFVPRLGKKSLEAASAVGGLGSAATSLDDDAEFIVKRGPSAFTPRIGRAAFTPRIGRSDGSNGQMRTLRTFTPRIGK